MRYFSLHTAACHQSVGVIRGLLKHDASLHRQCARSLLDSEPDRVWNESLVHSIVKLGPSHLAVIEMILQLPARVGLRLFISKYRDQPSWKLLPRWASWMAAKKGGEVQKREGRRRPGNRTRVFMLAPSASARVLQRDILTIKLAALELLEKVGSDVAYIPPARERATWTVNRARADGQEPWRRDESTLPSPPGKFFVSGTSSALLFIFFAISKLWDG